MQTWGSHDIGWGGNPPRLSQQTGRCRGGDCNQGGVLTMLMPLNGRALRILQPGKRWAMFLQERQKASNQEANQQKPQWRNLSISQRVWATGPRAEPSRSSQLEATEVSLPLYPEKHPTELNRVPTLKTQELPSFNITACSSPWATLISTEGTAREIL